MSENTLMIVLRLIHIICGVFWGGAAMALAWFLLPAQRAMGQPGAAFMQQLMFKQRMRPFVLGAMTLTVLSGLTMYVRLTTASNGEFSRNTTGMALGVGAVTAIIAGGIGSGLTGRWGKRMMALGGTIQASGGPPTEEQKTEMESLQRKMRGAFHIIAVLLLITLVTMASARYL